MILCDGNYGLGAYGMYLVHSRPREPEYYISMSDIFDIRLIAHRHYRV